MAAWRKSKFYYPFLIIVSIILTVIFYSGIVMMRDLTGRMIIGTIWLIVSIGWFSRYVMKYKNKTTG